MRRTPSEIADPFQTSPRLTVKFTDTYRVSAEFTKIL